MKRSCYKGGVTNPPTLALDKSLSLLSLLVADAGASSVSALATEAGLPPATAHRIVATLERRGFITKIARGRYLAGPALLRLANAASLNGVMKAVAQPILANIAKQSRLVAHLGVFEGDMVTYLVKAGRQNALFTREGMQLEAYCSAIGKMLLALLPDEQRERYLASGPFVALTGNTITDPTALRAELEHVRLQDFACDQREIDDTLRCVAVPVRDANGAAVAALSLSAQQLSGDVDPTDHLATLRAGSLAIEARLFPRVNSRPS
jgi:DNA-binding IclR family transcriptional regulator